MMWLLLDTTIHAGLQPALEARGVRCVHAGLEGLGGADERRLLQAALEDECVLVTRNYAGFTELAEAYRAVGRSVPPLLFVSSGSMAPAEAAAGERIEAQADAIAAWLEAERPRPASGRIAWVTPRPAVAP